ncbi:hypothetical protein D3C71_2006070 [compost metagenome]
MYDAQTFTGVSKQPADKLRAIVRPDHRHGFPRLDPALDSLLQRLNHMLGFTNRSSVLLDHNSV